MSTRGTEAYSDDWHLFHDVMEPRGEDGERPLYLEIHPRYVETTDQDGPDVTVTLPPDLARIVRAGMAALGEGKP